VLPPSVVFTSPSRPIAQPSLAETKVTSVARKPSGAGGPDGSVALGVGEADADGGCEAGLAEVGVGAGDEEARGDELVPVHPATAVAAIRTSTVVFTAC
jgi:hypothetical protein